MLSMLQYSLSSDETLHCIDLCVCMYNESCMTSYVAKSSLSKSPGFFCVTPSVAMSTTFLSEKGGQA